MPNDGSEAKQRSGLGYLVAVTLRLFMFLPSVHYGADPA